MRATAPLLLLLVLTLAASRGAAASARGALPAQPDWATSGGSPALDWRTLEVAGYRLHFPAPAEPWARHLAARLPALRERVAAAVGFDADDVVDVVLADPLAQPNGAAWPLLGRPRLVLLLTPPGASSQLSDFGDWPELLVTHEQAHLAHLLRPSRNPLLRALRLPTGPIALRAPRWAVEGYATLLEGRLTGSGRPASALRAAVLRRWAQRGQLPSYRALANDSRRYLGGAMAYLAGSAFLEWLETRERSRGAPAGSLDRLWRRLTAREARGFDDAFAGVFGDSPTALWGRFTAELTWQAIEVEREVGAVRDGAPWLDRSWGTGAPALSRDGARLVVALAARDRPLRLAVYATAGDEEARRRAAERDRELLARDPEDAPAIEREAPSRKPLATLELPDTTVEPTPRFLADGSVLFARSLPDSDGSYRADLFRWWPEGGRVARLTRGADLRAADPAPDDRWAAALTGRWGATGIARVDLATGAVVDLVPSSVEVVVDAPRVAPDGTRLAYLRHRDEGWELVVRELASGEERVIDAPEGGSVQDPAWAPGGDSLYAVVGAGGMLDVHELPLAGASRRVTRSPGATLAPAPTPDGGALFFLALEPEGLQVRRVEMREDEGEGVTGRTPAVASASDAGAAATVPSAAPSAGGGLVSVPPSTGEPAASRENLYPAIAPPPRALPEPLPLVTVPASAPYRLGRGSWSFLSGGSASVAGSSAELGARGGDLVGRWELLALGALGTDAGATGVTVAAAWRGWPVAVTAQAYRLRERPSAQRRATAATFDLDAFDLDTEGVELATGWERPTLGGAVGLHLALAMESLAPRASGEALDRHRLALDAFLRRELRRASWRVAAEGDLAWQRGETDGEGWSRRGGSFDLDASHGDTSFAFGITRRDVDGRPSALDLVRVGGMRTSLLPASAEGERIFVAALPAAGLVGRDYQGERLAFALPGWPLRAFWARQRVRSPLGSGVGGSIDATAGWGPWLSLAGLDFDLALPPLPLLDIPAARLELGLAYLLDEPYRHDWSGWVGVVWRP
jgi:hypothetical protein